MTPALPLGLLAAYRRTRYRVGDVEVRVGRRSDALLRSYGVREAVLVTAWNPFSRLMPLGWNRRMQARLAERVRLVGCVAASGGDRGWSEDHLLLLMPAAKAAVLGRRFRQNAVLVLRLGRGARLVVLR